MAKNVLHIELLVCGTTPAGALDGKELLPIELEVEVGEPKLQESCLQVRRVVCVTNAPVPQGTTAFNNATVRKGRV